jgi:hypothetical protein
MNKPVVGKFYKIVHTRKGTFYAKILSINGDLEAPDTFIDVEVTKGRANAIMDYNICYPGDILGIRNSHSLFYEVTESEAQEVKDGKEKGD